MKKVLLILVSVMIAEFALGQIQYGYVRTIGRSNRPGAGIDSVLIKIKDCKRVKSHSMGTVTDDDREGIHYAYKEAIEVTLWERITKTNHKDVTYYKGLLEEYTRDLLLTMRNDFLEEITGEHIKNKTFEDD